MESTNPSPSSSSHQPDAGKEGTPFAQKTVQISKQEHVQLKWGNRYWQRQHSRALERIAELKQELECAQAEIRDLKQRLYGVSRVEEPRKIGEKIWRRIALYPTQQKRASYGPLFCPKQTLFKSPGHPSSITLAADLQLCLVLHAVALGWVFGSD
jgi:hypothetical protein